MNVAILSESDADEAACRILTEAIHGPITWINKPPLRSRGWPSILSVLPTVIKHLHYQTVADRLVVVVDSNHSPVHTTVHAEQPDLDCKVCKLLAAADHVVARLTPIANRNPLRVAIALAVPAIEAWYLVGLRGEVTEAAWVTGRAQDKDPYSKRQLKTWKYGTDIPSLREETRHATDNATRLASRLELLETAFPEGFGLFRRQVDAW